MFHTSTAGQKSTESVREPHLCCEIFSSGGSDVSEVVGGYSGREDSGSVHSPLSRLIVLLLGGKQEVMNSTLITHLASTHDFLPDGRLHS